MDNKNGKRYRWWRKGIAPVLLTAFMLVVAMSIPYTLADEMETSVEILDEITLDYEDTLPDIENELYDDSTASEGGYIEIEGDYDGQVTQDVGGYVGIDPLTIPTGTITTWGTTVTTRAQLQIAMDNAPLNAPATTFFRINVAAGAAGLVFDQTVIVNRQGANIILTTVGTNTNVGNNPAFGTGATPRELRHGGAGTNPGRHFTISNGARLMLVNIIVDGRNAAGAAVPVGTRRGGVNVLGAGSVLTAEANSIIRNNRNDTSLEIVNHDGGGVTIRTGARFNLQSTAVIENNHASFETQTTNGGGGVLMMDSTSRFYMTGGYHSE